MAVRQAICAFKLEHRTLNFVVPIDIPDSPEPEAKDEDDDEVDFEEDEEEDEPEYTAMEKTRRKLATKIGGLKLIDLMELYSIREKITMEFLDETLQEKMNG